MSSLKLQRKNVIQLGMQRGKNLKSHGVSKNRVLSRLALKYDQISTRKLVPIFIWGFDRVSMWKLLPDLLRGVAES